ncbi:hypothetical protein TH19_14445 [Thalassospira profundimaris]|uniref:Uncharacterized protein n=1 Tax=Thalassospira profundimaris TaxID=502049 RepID=A0A367W3W0_9PROT|nr:hypothetical protein TH19_14445 [Thalassospira profundimaris]
MDQRITDPCDQGQLTYHPGNSIVAQSDYSITIKQAVQSAIGGNHRPKAGLNSKFNGCSHHGETP